MADFKPTATPYWVYDKDAVVYMSVGWYSSSGTWLDIEPLIENPDGPGVRAWSVVHGADPWFVQKPVAL